MILTDTFILDAVLGKSAESTPATAKVDVKEFSKLSLKPSKKFSRHLTIYRATDGYNISMSSRSRTMLVFAAGRTLRLDQSHSNLCAWLDSTAFDLTLEEARKISQHFQIAMPATKSGLQA